MQRMNTGITRKPQHYQNQNVNDYVTASGISLDEVWATDAEVMATASLICYDVAVYTKVGYSMQKLKYPISSSLQSMTDHTLYLENVSEHFNVVSSDVVLGRASLQSALGEFAMAFKPLR